MMHRVFVYGSLKRGFHNNRLLEESRFLGERITSNETWTMYSLGAFPGVIKSFHAGVCASISGDLYEVSDQTLTRLDMLESNGSFYKRELVPLHGEDEPAWMYVLINPAFFMRDMRPIYEGDHIFYRW